MSVRRNTLLNVAGSAFPLIAAALFIPYVLRALGDSAFGVLTLIWVVIGYFGVFDLGVGRALTVEISRLQATGATPSLRPTLLGGLLITVATGTLGAVLLLCLASPLAKAWLKIDPALQQDVLQAFSVTSIGVLATTLTSGIRGALEGYGRFGATNVSRMVLGLLMFSLPALSVWLHGISLTAISMYLVGARIVVAIMAAYQLRQELRSPGDRLTIDHLRPLFGFGFWMTVTGIVSPLMVYGDRFFVSAVAGVSELPIYSIPQEGLLRLLILPAAFTAALLPSLTSAGKAERQVAYRSACRRVAGAMGGICILVSIVAYPALAWWLDENFAQRALPIVLILVIGVWTNALATVPYTLLHAAGQPKVTALFHLLELALYVIALWWLTNRFGLPGAAAAWVFRTSLDLVLLHTAARRMVLSPL